MLLTEQTFDEHGDGDNDDEHGDDDDDDCPFIVRRKSPCTACLLIIHDSTDHQNY